jgi:Secretion system C-terminal sorting domain
MTYGAVRVATTNQCGTSGYSGITVYPNPGGCGGYFVLYPNPASDDVTIAINESSSNEETGDGNMSNLKSTSTDATKPTNFTIRIFNNQGSLLLTFNRSGQNFTIPLGTLKDGIYIVELNDSKNSYRQQVVVKRN